LLSLLLFATAVLAGSGTATAAGGAAPHWKSWLCFPNRPHDWCYVGLDTVVVSPTGALNALKVAPSSNPLHAADINIDLANLLSLVRAEAHAFVLHH
jgi:hypothetical protein